MKAWSRLVWKFVVRMEGSGNHQFSSPTLFSFFRQPSYICTRGCSRSCTSMPTSRAMPWTSGAITS